MTSRQGGCHCGRIRYRIEGEPFDADYCHCLDCQKTTGAPVAAWMDFNAAQVHWLGEMPAEYASSASIRRGFCSNCGCSISYRSTAYPDFLTLSICTLDEPSKSDGDNGNEIAPKYHIHTASRRPWLEIADELPRYAAARNPASKS
ncbi:GFA family protein [Shewanella sp. JM162201]|uniref:GFA family protein n=1 Tax=Shewanella jiangmenensis TaxID=2837387 RepID=A0ABS5V5W4_9GAMM|nr:GFA family protein [Shewanella jiangmenensis]MBT1445006.1 GFA family protein [Shewanella jiangmenensis]